MTKKSQLWDHTDFFFSFSVIKYLSSCFRALNILISVGCLVTWQPPRPPSSMQNSVTITAVFYSHEDANVGDGSGSGEV